MTEAEVLAAYKRQPRLERRHATLKGVIEAAPIELKSVAPRSRRGAEAWGRRGIELGQFLAQDRVEPVVSRLGAAIDLGDLKPQQTPVSYTHLRAHETVLDLVCRLLLENKK